MEVFIDISVFAPSVAVGLVSGTMDLSLLPRVGETLSFVSSKNTETFPSGFGGLLKVEDVIISVDAASPPGLALESINATSIEEATQIGKYLEAAFGLHFDPYAESST